MDPFMGSGSSLQNSSSATSGVGDQIGGGFYGGTVNASNPNKPNYLLMGGLALLALVLWKKL